MMKGEKISERRLKGLSINLKKLTATMERNASAAIKRLQDFKKKSLDEASTLQTDVDDNMTEIEENLQEKSEEYEEMLQDTEDTLKDAGAVQSYVFLTFILTFGEFLANFKRLVLGCIEAECCE